MAQEITSRVSPVCSLSNDISQFLAAGHCDGTYETPAKDLRSFYTLHLYLNDAVASGGEVEGGATTFHPPLDASDRRVDVDPKMGRILIFQHRQLLHSGDEVKKGIKYTMR